MPREAVLAMTGVGRAHDAIVQGSGAVLERGGQRRARLALAKRCVLALGARQARISGEVLRHQAKIARQRDCVQHCVRLGFFYRTPRKKPKKGEERTRSVDALCQTCVKPTAPPRIKLFEPAGYALSMKGGKERKKERKKDRKK